MPPRPPALHRPQDSARLIDLRTEVLDLAAALDRDLERAPDLVPQLTAGLGDPDTAADPAALAGAFALAGLLAAELRDARVRTRRLVRKFDREPASAVGETLTGVLDLARDLARHLHRARVRDVQRAARSAARLVLALEGVWASGTGLPDDLERDYEQAAALVLKLASELRDARGPGARGADRDRVLALGRALVLACDLARILTGMLGTVVRRIPVDASGADLSGLRVPHAEALAGVVWDDRTIWPLDVRDRIRDLSDESHSGRYRVRGGPGSDPLTW
ncbi:hypothetical protein [Actinomadura fibrosa]|uniref:Uncharacterized protein n=1 Tax=Actinomadura fibrosa TaxID=111802 RepID=A0ABW2XNF4_9ACTN|nr:hypothetical protein [Actinomadura fibrosa]